MADQERTFDSLLFALYFHVGRHSFLFSRFRTHTRTNKHMEPLDQHLASGSGGDGDDFAEQIRKIAKTGKARAIENLRLRIRDAAERGGRRVCVLPSEFPADELRAAFPGFDVTEDAGISYVSWSWHSDK